MSDILETANRAGPFKTLALAIREAGLSNTLKGEGPFTVFAPTDEAFAKLPKGALAELLQDKEKLVAFLTSHVATGEVTSLDLESLSSLKTIGGEDIEVYSRNGLKVNNANVVKRDIQCDNGFIQAIDEVILAR